MSNDLGIDRSGNNNNWTVTNMTYSDIMLDSPTNNFCTLNAVEPTVGTLSEGNLKSVATDDFNKATFQIPQTGKWYWELGVVTVASMTHGVVDSVSGVITRHYRQANNGDIIIQGASSVNSGVGYTDGDVISASLDMDNDTIQFRVNNSSAGGAYALDGNQKNLVPYFHQNSGSGTATGIYNFGQDSSFAGTETAQGNQDSNGIGDFYYEPPSGFLALCTSNLPEPAVTPSEHFNTVLWTGNDTARSITGVGFQPDFVWTKERGSATPNLFDVLRGVNNSIFTNGTGGEVRSETDLLTAFAADGFSLGVNAGSQSVNRDTDTYVAWNWKAGGSGSANTDGDMAETVTVSANTDAGFSIVTYTGDGSAATVGHGLSKAPEVIIVKHNTVLGDYDWRVYHSGNTAAPETDYLELNDDAATADDADAWNDTAPTSSVFTIGDGDEVNKDDTTYVAYCFHSVDGFSKMGSYEGNGDADGTFIYTGFRPAWLMIKNIEASNKNWLMVDTVRETFNPVANAYLFADTGGAEVTDNDKDIDILSNGFKLRFDTGFHSDDGVVYIYIAFAETPFKYSNAR